MMLVLSGLSSCSSDDPQHFESDVTEEPDKCVSTFTLGRELWNVISSDGAHTVGLVPEGADEMTRLNAELGIRQEEVECKIYIQRPLHLTDGMYNLYLFDGKGRRVASTLAIQMRGEKIVSADTVMNHYRAMSGTGSEEDPYIITKQSDFMNMIMTIDSENGAHGSGLWFKQTADIEVPPQSSMTTGRGYYSTSFGGHYDGGSFKLTGLNYTGANNADKDRYVGLFARLLDGSSVSNVVIDGLDISGVSYAGALAGAASGTVTISNVSATGNISLAGDYIGGLIGYSENSLTVDKYDFNVTISGGKYVGGVAGNADGALTVRNLSTDHHRFRLTSTGNCGGVAGGASGTVTLENIVLDHSVQSEDGDLRIISTGTGENCGGAVGMLKADSQSVMKKISLMTPVGGGDNVGGIVGMADAPKSLTFDGCQVSSLVSGHNNVGGMAGKVVSNSAGALSLQGSPSRVIIDFNAGEVSGEENIGGLFGLVDGYAPQFGTTVELAMNVSGKKSTGGIFGTLGADRVSASSNKLDLSKINFSSTTIQIKGTDVYTGGVAGLINGCAVSYPQSFSFSSDGKAATVDVDKLTPFFKGQVRGADYTGGVAGAMLRCTVSGAVLGGTVAGDEYVGGIAGKFIAADSSNTPVSACATTSKAYVEGSGRHCGGIFGVIDDNRAKNPFEMRDCANTGIVKGGDSTGGIVGIVYVRTQDYTLQWLVNNAAVSAKGTAGGIVGGVDLGSSNHLRIVNSANFAGISADADSNSYIGGILGCTFSNHVHVVSCANHGLISGGAHVTCVGGLVGHMGHDPSGVSQSENIEISNSMNSGEVKSSYNDANVGGLLGYQEEGTQNSHDEYSVYYCYNAGRVSSDQHDDNGGLVGKVSHYSKLHRCMNYGRVEHGNATIGTRQSSAIVYHDYLHYQSGSGKDWYANNEIPESKLSDKSQYSGFDFDHVWIIQDGRAELRACPWQNITTFP